MEKLAHLAPDVLLVERSVARDAQDALLGQNISLALNVKRSMLDRLARCTGTQVCPAGCCGDQICGRAFVKKVGSDNVCRDPKQAIKSRYAMCAVGREVTSRLQACLQHC